MLILTHKLNEQFKTAKDISLFGNKISDKGVEHILNAIKENKNVTTLNLRWNRINDKGVEDLFNALNKIKI